MKKSPFLLIGILLISLSGCGFAIQKAMGLKRMKPISEAAIIKAANEFGIPPEHSYVLDSLWVRRFKDGASVNGAEIKDELQKNHLQPLQASYYNSEGKLVSFQVNCYAGGFPNLNWTRDSIFSSFPPRTQAPADTLITLNEHLQFLRQLNGTSPASAGSAYTVVIHWTRFMGRQTALFLRTIRENAKLSGVNNSKFIYVNCDNIYFREK
ncbi:MAG: hypothetical protein ACRC3B_14650 [Bacteroidia bacterium]